MLLLLIVDSNLTQLSLSIDILGHYYATTANSRQLSHPAQPLYRYIGTLLCYYYYYCDKLQTYSGYVENILHTVLNLEKVDRHILYGYYDRHILYGYYDRHVLYRYYDRHILYGYYPSMNIFLVYTVLHSAHINLHCVSLVYRFRGWAKSFPLLSRVCTPAKDDTPQKRTAIR